MYTCLDVLSHSDVSDNDVFRVLSDVFCDVLSDVFCDVLSDVDSVISDYFSMYLSDVSAVMYLVMHISNDLVTYCTC